MPRDFSLLFDLDGTLANTDALHLRAFQEILRGSAAEIDERFYHSNIVGRTNAHIIAEAFPDASAEQRQFLAARKEHLYRSSLTDVRAVPGASEILEWVRENGLRCAVVTTSPRESAEAVLDVLGLRKFFSLLVTGDDVERGKPDPLPYLTALRKLEISAEEAVAFEDSLSGVSSACAAGLTTVGLGTSLSEDALIAAGAIRTAMDFTDVGIRKLINERQQSLGFQPP